MHKPFAELRLKVDARQIARPPRKCMQMYALRPTYFSLRFLIPFTYFFFLCVSSQRRLSVLRQQDVRGPESIMQLRCEREQMEF